MWRVVGPATANPCTQAFQGTAGIPQLSSGAPAGRLLRELRRGNQAQEAQLLQLSAGAAELVRARSQPPPLDTLEIQTSLPLLPPLSRSQKVSVTFTRLQPMSVPAPASSVQRTPQPFAGRL